MRGFVLFTVTLFFYSQVFSQVAIKTFESYLEKYSGGECVLKQETLRPTKGISADTANYLLFTTSEAEVYWSAIAAWIVNNHIVTLCERSFPAPELEDAPYKEYWLVSYTK